MSASPEPETPKASFNPRMHSGGKLSFRRRVRHVEDSGDLPIVFGGEKPPLLGELVPAGYQQVEVEIGCGKGAFLLAAAELSPDTFFLGIEAASSYARYSAERLKKHGHENTLMLVDNARLYVEDGVPAGSLDRVHVYYPDPWPKRRHRKRRFFTETMPEILHRALKPGGWLLVATDNAAYAGQIARVLGGSPWLRRDEAEEQRIMAAEPGTGFSPTNFERKYLAEGRVLRRYAFQRVDS